MAWWRGENTASGSVDDIYYAVRDSSGNVVKGSTKLTNDNPGDSGYSGPALASISSNRAFLSWLSSQDGNDDIYYAVVGSDGNLIKTATDLSVDETVVDWANYDAVQLSDGRILAVWQAWGCFPDEWVPRIRYALLDSSYNRIESPVCLSRNSAATTGDNYVSVTGDGDGHAILTWMDSDYNNRRNLYYALVNSSGTQVTPPMIFRTSQATSPYIETSYSGYGNAGYSQSNALACHTYLPVTLRNYFHDPYEDDDSWQTAYGPLVFGKEYQAYPYDSTDYFYFELSTNSSVTILLQNYQATGDLILYKHREGDEPEFVEGKHHGRPTMQIGPRTLQAGKYYIRVYTTADYNRTSLYTLKVSTQ